MKPASDMTRDELMELIERLRSRIDLHNGQLQGMQDSFLKRLKVKDKAARLANARADAAVKTARVALDAVTNLNLALKGFEQ